MEGRGVQARRAESLRQRRALVKSVFEDAYQYMKSGTLLRQVINKLQEDIDFNDLQVRDSANLSSKHAWNPDSYLP